MLTERQLNRATLARQMLLRREAVDVATAMKRVVALQAQEPASPYIALWNRVAEFDAAELDAAFTDYRVVKGTTLRITLHAVHLDDYPGFHDGMQHALRGSRLNDARFTTTGLSAADADALLPDLLAFLERPRTNAEVERWVGDRLGEGMSRAWWALRTYAPVWRAPTGGPWSFGSTASFVAARGHVPRASTKESVQRVIRRYLEGFGPATIADAAQATVITRSVAREAIEAMADELRRLHGPGGADLYDVPDGLLPGEDTPAPPRLLPMWDNTLLAYADRRRVIPADVRRHVIRANGDVLPTLLVDGNVAGVWRPVDGGIEASAFHRLADEAWSGLESEASGLAAFLAERDPNVYRRYGRWWAKLPVAEVRVLTG